MHRNSEENGPLAVRMARVAGQVRGVRRMIDEGRPCLEIAGQLSAAVGALRQVRLKLLAAHLQSCLIVGGKPWQPEMLQARVEEIFLALADTERGKAPPNRRRRAPSNGAVGRNR